MLFSSSFTLLVLQLYTTVVLQYTLAEFPGTTVPGSMLATKMTCTSGGGGSFLNNFGS